MEGVIKGTLVGKSKQQNSNVPIPKGQSCRLSNCGLNPCYKYRFQAMVLPRLKLPLLFTGFNLRCLLQPTTQSHTAFGSAQPLPLMPRPRRARFPPPAPRLGRGLPDLRLLAARVWLRPCVLACRPSPASPKPSDRTTAPRANRPPGGPDADPSCSASPSPGALRAPKARNDRA